MPIFFYLGEDYPERMDTRVRVIDYDEVTNTSKVEFPDGFRAVVSRFDLISRTVGGCTCTIDRTYWPAARRRDPLCPIHADEEA